MTRDEEVISAAVLHDTIEDCQGVTREVLALEFSPRVAAMVAGESEDKSRPDPAQLSGLDIPGRKGQDGAPEGI